MKYLVSTTERFNKDIKFYKRKRKYRHIEDDVNSVVEELKVGNFIGDEITGLRLPDIQSAYRVRAANSDTKVGKTGGYRVIYYVIKEDFHIVLLTIYYKKDKEIISNEEIIQLINDLL